MKKTLLQIQTSIFSDGGESSRLARTFVADWQKAHAPHEVIVRDIGREMVPHLTAERFQSFLARPADRTPEQRAVAEYSDTLIDEGEARRRDRAGAADVQLRRALVAQGVLRPRRAIGRHVSLHRDGLRRGC